MADLLLEKLNNISKKSLADPIKEEYSSLMQTPLDILYKQGKEKEVHRLGLITLGAVRRDQHVDWWCEKLHEQMQNKTVIIPDIRFVNEVEYFANNSHKFILFEVSADEDTRVSRGWVESFADTTTTETEINKFKHKITKTLNNSDTDDNELLNINQLINDFELS